MLGHAHWILGHTQKHLRTTVGSKTQTRQDLHQLYQKNVCVTSHIEEASQKGMEENANATVVCRQGAPHVRKATTKMDS